jgi:DNA polymerase-3 subunit alpha
MEFVHLNVRSSYSQEYSILKIKDIFSKAREFGHKAVALTDLGTLMGVTEFLNTAESYPEIKPIIGLSMPVELFESNHRLNTWFTFLAKDIDGYRCLVKLSSFKEFDCGHVESCRYGNLMKVLQEYKGHIICICNLTYYKGLLKGIQETNSDLLRSNINGRDYILTKLKNLFGDDLYLEVVSRQGHKDSMHRTLQIAKLNDIKVVATNMVAYLLSDHLSDMKKVYPNTFTPSCYRDKQLEYIMGEAFFKDTKQMFDELGDYPEILGNTIEIADKCSRYSIKTQLRVPKYPFTDTFETSFEYLKAKVENQASSFFGENIESRITDRISYELQIIHDESLSDYFLLMSEIVSYMKGIGAAIGPGRFNMAGSIVNFLLGITEINPLEYGLLFEPFVCSNYLPNITLDIEQGKRFYLIEWLERRFGRGNVLFSPNVFRYDAKRIMINEFCRSSLDYHMIEQHYLTPSRTEWEYKWLPDYQKEIVDSNPEIWNIIRHAAIIGNTVKEVKQMQSCFQILGPENKELVPFNKGNFPPLHLMSQIQHFDTDKYGILELTFYSLSILDIIKDCCQLIKERCSVDVDIENIPLDDEATYNIFCDGDIEGIFQFDSFCVKERLAEFKPGNFMDLLSFNSLYTCKSMQLIPQYLHNKKHGIEYANDVEHEVLSETYGILLYREQMIEMIHKLSNLSKNKAWNIVRAIETWNPDERREGEKLFYRNASENGYDNTYLRAIWSRLVDRYRGESKSHKTCYTLIAYRCAWLKAHYAKEFEESCSKY